MLPRASVSPRPATSGSRTARGLHRPSPQEAAALAAAYRASDEEEAQRIRFPAAEVQSTTLPARVIPSPGVTVQQRELGKIELSSLSIRGPIVPASSQLSRRLRPTVGGSSAMIWLLRTLSGPLMHGWSVSESGNMPRGGSPSFRPKGRCGDKSIPRQCWLSTAITSHLGTEKYQHLPDRRHCLDDAGQQSGAPRIPPL